MDDCPQLIPLKVPVVVLTGFLGSGKTTLLQYILTNEHHLRIAVIVNEFEFGRSIEKGLTLKSSQKAEDEWIELANGCMCCSAQNQTVATMEKLVRSKPFDLILVETSGMADPTPVATMFWQDEALGSLIFLSGIIAVVDSKNICRFLSEKTTSREATQQLLVADKIIMNKLDLVESEKDRIVVFEAIRRVNPSAEIVSTAFCRVDNLKELLTVDTTHSALHALPQSACEHSIHTLSLEWGNLCFANRSCLDYVWREILYLSNSSQEIVRSKGVVWVLNGQPELVQVQTIGDTFDVQHMAGQRVVPVGCCRMIFYGRNLNSTVLQEIFNRFGSVLKASGVPEAVES